LVTKSYLQQKDKVMKHIKKYLKALLAAIQKNQQQRADHWMLSNMSDRDLKDVGITRGQINGIIYSSKEREKHEYRQYMQDMYRTRITH